MCMWNVDVFGSNDEKRHLFIVLVDFIGLVLRYGFICTSHRGGSVPGTQYEINAIARETQT